MLLLFRNWLSGGTDKNGGIKQDPVLGGRAKGMLDDEQDLIASGLQQTSMRSHDFSKISHLIDAPQHRTSNATLPRAADPSVDPHARVYLSYVPPVAKVITAPPPGQRRFVHGQPSGAP